MGQLYDFEDEKVEGFLKRHKVKLAAIQLPAGLRKYLREITLAFEDRGVDVVVLADSCYGACDLADAKAKQIGCDVLVHYGHADMGLSTRLPILYVEARMKADPSDIVKQALPGLEFKRLGLATTVQHIDCLKNAAEIISAKGIEVVIGKPGPRAKYPGQILGCDLGCVKSIADRVDGFMYIGTGKFHPLGITLTTGKDVLIVNPLAEVYEKLELGIDDFLKHRKAAVMRAATCRKFGILVSTKPGQERFALARSLMVKLKSAGRMPSLLVVDEVSPEGLGEFTQIEAFVCCACPRIPIDDAGRFEKPVLTPFEAEAAIGETSFEHYRLDEII